jgi:hypothetical protein
MDEMRRRGRFDRGMSGDTMQTQAPSGPFGGASLYPGMNPGLNPEMRPGMMPPAQPAMPAARPVSTFPDAMPAGANSDMTAFRAARAGGAPMKKGGKVDSYAKGGTVRGWGLARGGRKVKIV